MMLSTLELGQTRLTGDVGESRSQSKASLFKGGIFALVSAWLWYQSA